MAPIVNFSGLASGIDSSALIEALLDQERKTQVTPLENKIVDYENTNSDLEELSTLADDLKGLAEKFRVINGGAVSKTGQSSNENVAGVITSNAAQTGTYNLSVTQLASNGTFSFDDRFGSGSSVVDSGINNVAPAADRTVSFTIGTGADSESVDIVMTDSTTASDFVVDFNSQSSKALASLVNTGTEASPSYAIMITSNEEGTEDGTITLDSVGVEITSFASNTLNQATDAQFAIDGINGSITRSSNTVSDVMSGVTFDLKSTGNATITVGVDAATTELALEELVEKYNEIVEFINEGNKTERIDSGVDSTVIFGPLASTSVDDGFLSAIRSAISSSSTSGSSVNIFADLGITTERDGTLKFDADTFSEALGNEPGSVESILTNFGETLGAVDGTIAQYTRFKGLFDDIMDSNDRSVLSLNEQIARAEKDMTAKEDSLIKRFSRLESLIGQLQSQQNQLASILPS